MKKNKKIAIFLDTRKESGGEYQHLLYTIENIKKNNRKNYQFIIVCLSKNLNLNLEKKFDLEIKYFSMKSFMRYVCYLRNHNSFIRRIKKYFFQNQFENFLAENNVDMVYFTSPSQYSLYLEKTKFFITVPDLDHREHVEFPEVVDNSEYERKNEIFSKALPKALAIITNAQIIKNRLNSYYNISLERIYIINLRPAQSVNNFKGYTKEKEIFYEKKFKLFEKYIFYPAMYLPHKNHKAVIDSLKILKEKFFLDIKAVFSGGDISYKKNLKSYAFSNGLENNIRFLNFVEDDALPYLYKKAFALIFPVLIGPTFTPPWEAFKLETPVIFSNLDGVKPVYGEQSMVYIDPLNANEIASAVKKVLENESLRLSLIENGKNKLEEIEEKNEYSQIYEIIDKYRKLKLTWEPE